MSKTVEVIADLTLELDGDKIYVTNDTDGDLVIHFPNKKTLGKFLKTRFALDASLSSLGRVNKRLKEEKQPAILRVNHEDWIILGRYDNPVVKYNKLAPVLLNKSFSSDRNSWYIAASIVGGGLLAALLYCFAKRQN